MSAAVHTENQKQTNNSAAFPRTPKAHQRAVGKGKKDIYQDITNKVIQALEKGGNPWRCPWDKDGIFSIPKNYKTGAFYQGINIPLLWIAQEEGSYSSSCWLTYKQAQEMGGQVRKGEAGTSCIFYKPWERKTGEQDKNGEDRIEIIPMVRGFTVFNIDQIDGIEIKHLETNQEDFQPIQKVEDLITASKVEVIEGGTRCCYVPSEDFIKMADRGRFSHAYNYYASLAHELTHATKAKKRCDRKPYNSEDSQKVYAFEELVAELGSLFVMGHIGLKGELENHVSYLSSWIQLLKEDKKAIFKASALAQKSCDWIMSQGKEEG